MSTKTNLEYMVEAADFYRARNDEARKEIELLKAMLDEAKAVSLDAFAKKNAEIERLRDVLHEIISMDGEYQGKNGIYVAQRLARAALGEKK